MPPEVTTPARSSPTSPQCLPMQVLCRAQRQPSTGRGTHAALAIARATETTGLRKLQTGAPSEP
eukprot:1976273-Lingulodinium_polyedra.AAC.1